MRRLCRILFSRYAISAILILLSIYSMIAFAFRLMQVFPLLLLCAAVFSVAALVHIINRDTNPEYKITWIVVVMLLPYGGALLYVMFSGRRFSKKERRLLLSIDPSSQDRGETDRALVALGIADPSAAGCASAILADDRGAGLFSATSARYYGDGAEMFRDMLADLSRAESFIFMEYFIVSDGVMWQKIHEILLQKVRSGCVVRLLYDDIGSMGCVPTSFDRILRADGIDAHRFAPISPRVTIAHNHRDHRKYTIVDGRIGYTGGINLADEYIGEKIRFGKWKDGGIRLVGDAVSAMTASFLVTFDFACGGTSDHAPFLSACRAECSDGGYYLPFGSGPHPIYNAPVGKNALLQLINRADRYLYLTTPYLIIDFELCEAFGNAARRGVDVRIITPGIPDKRLIHTMSRSMYPSLVHRGVRIFEYKPGFIHEKLAVADDRYAIIGTINLDYRSLVHHFENAVWMYDTPVIERVRDGFLHTLAASQEVGEREMRLPFFKKIVKDIVRLFAPLL